MSSLGIWNVSLFFFNLFIYFKDYMNTCSILLNKEAGKQQQQKQSL